MYPSEVRSAHALGSEEVLEHFSVDTANGLTSERVEELRSQYGRNSLPVSPPTPMWKLVVGQFDDLLVRILLVAAIISLILALFEEGDDMVTAYVEPVVIGLILVANAIVGVIQETNAEKAIEALKQYTPDMCTVIRNGKIGTILSEELVPGDIVEVTLGNKVPADIRICKIYSALLGADQSVFTGEGDIAYKSEEPSNLDAIVQEKTSMVFMGTTISLGRARGIVVGTGEGTELGKIHSEIQSSEDINSPLEEKMEQFGKHLSIIILIICIIVWIINIGNFTDPSHGGLLRGAIYYFKIAVALAVAAIPEGLPAVVTTCLALGTVKMAKKNAIVRSLPSVETLGCTTVICSDKTGTLTTNQMSVTRFAVFGDFTIPKIFSVSGTTYNPNGEVSHEISGQALYARDHSSAIKDLAAISALCNNAHLEHTENSDVYSKVGESTEAALLTLVEKLGADDGHAAQAPENLSNAERTHFFKNYWESVYKKVATLDFARDRKSMSVLCERKRDGAAVDESILLVKGAPESLLSRCSLIELDNGKSVEMTKSFKTEFLQLVHEWSSGKSGLRCLALAKKEGAISAKNIHSISNEDYVKVESDLTLVGLVGMKDPPREEVADAIEKCRSAGIRVVVVTGDNKETAESVCRAIGLIERGDDVSKISFTGRELGDMPRKEQLDVARTAVVLSRVEPSHKSLLIDLLHEQHEIAAMTGDGVNDAPALKKADIGIAMGSGTAVAREASAMVLADDNFSTIILAIEEGRAIYNNTKQFIRYLISSNIGEVASIFLGTLFGLPEALIPVQLLWVNFVTDGLPATALGFNKPDKDIMVKPPRPPTEPIVSKWLLVRYMIIGIYVGFATVGGFAYWYLYAADGPMLTWHELTHFHDCEAMGVDCEIFANKIPGTIALTILCSIEMFNAMNAVSENLSLLTMPLWSNLWLCGAITLSFVLHFFILYVPFLAKIFNAAPLTVSHWMIVLALSLPVIPMDEVLKLFTRWFLEVRTDKRS